VQVPPTQSIASRVVAKLACISVRVCSEPSSVRMQAASSSPEINMIVDGKDTSEMSKADALLPTEGSSPDHTMASDQDTTGV